MGVMLLNKEAILGAKDTHQEVVHVPEWGGSVCIRAMTGAERDDFRAAIEGAETSLVGKFEAPLLALTLVDEEGKRLFSIDDVEALRAKSATVLDRLAQIALRVNGMSAEAQEEAAKN